MSSRRWTGALAALAGAASLMVVVLDDPLQIAMYRIPGVPLAMVVDGVGRIALVRAGVFPPVAADSLVAFLGTEPKLGELVGRG